MKLNKEQIEQGRATDTTSRPSRPSDEELLQQEAELDENGDEYEYVPISEASSGIVSKVVAMLKEYSIIVLFLVVALACFIISAIGQYASSVFMAIAFSFLAGAAAYLLYGLWKEKKEAEEKYRHAKDVIEPVKQAMIEQALDSDN